MSEPDRAEAPASETDAVLDRIIKELDETGRELPVDAIREARLHRDALVPRLIQVLRNAAADARAGNTPEGQAPFFAFFLLGEFRAKEAMPAILEAMTLPGKLSSDLFGDAISSILRRVLVALAGDQLELYDRLIRDRELQTSVRWGAASAYQLLVRDGRLTRLEAVERLRQHLREAIENRDYEIGGPLISELACLAPAEAREEIVEAYRQDIAEPFLITLKEVEDSIEEGEEGFLGWQKRCPPTGIPDTIEELEKWASFREPPTPPPPVATPPRPRGKRPIARGISPAGPSPEPETRSSPRVGRNQPCPCGSGKKYKKCCGARRG
ncbi:MAG: DUF1186 domain-containing protein [Thermoguttaceae bacterium]